jgi:hypothetical protein
MTRKIYKSPVTLIEIIDTNMVIRTRQGEEIRLVIDFDTQKLLIEQLNDNIWIKEEQT